MQTTPVVSAAIGKLNECKQSAVEAEAQSLINFILGEQQTIARLNDEIRQHREELVKMSHDLISVESVTGSPAPAIPNINEETISKVILELNKSKQGSIEHAAKRLSDAVVGKQASIKATNDRITELRTKLAKLQAAVVTPETVLGA